MKYKRFTILLGVLSWILLVAWSFPAVTQAQWKVVAPHVKAGEKMRMAAFLDESFGITGGAGDVGKAHYTSDGGQTWTVADSSGA